MVSASTDHPRACGENTRLDSLPGLSPGSPPRMRGKQDLQIAPKVIHRITPAHAGKTDWRSRTSKMFSDHPRACGENIQVCFIFRAFRGSPPRMRGKPAQSGRDATIARITPAHAGKTFRSALSSARFADHPRACGENVLDILNQPSESGSPPRMRGKRQHDSVCGAQGRITPAHAGKTRNVALIARANTDHPRACGENQDGRCCMSGIGGSPPRMRGKHFGNGVFPWLILVLSLNPL